MIFVDNKECAYCNDYIFSFVVPFSWFEPRRSALELAEEYRGQSYSY